MTNYSNKTIRIKILAFLLIGTGIILLLIGLVPTAWLHQILDPLTSDNNMAALDLPQVGVARIGIAVLGVISLLVGLISLTKPDKMNLVFQWLQRFYNDFSVDNRRLFKELLINFPKGWEFLILIMVMAAGFYTRLVFLPAPMQYDEAVTFNDFASRSFIAAISDYSLPNNHVFHTLLVHIAFRLFGDAPWIVRLPAFLAGILCIPTAYIMGRIHYNRNVGWMAAALAAWWPQMVFYSANARGYSLLGFFSLINFVLAGVILKRRSLAAWFWMGLVSALGLFTVPVMAYSLGILYLWLLVSFIFNENQKNYQPKQYWTSLIATGITTLTLTIVLYLPVLFVSGPDSLFGNKFVRSFTWGEFTDRLPFFLDDIWMRFTQEMPWYAILLILLGLGLSILLHRKISQFKIPVLAVALLFFVVVMPIQRPEMLSKLFFFSLPLLAVWAAAGWGAILQLFPRKNLEFVISLLIMGIFAGSSIWQSLPNQPYLSGATGVHQQIVEWIEPRMEENDIVLVDFPVDAQILYYARRAGLSLDAFRELEQVNYQRAFVLVNPVEGQSLESVATKRDLLIPLDLETAKEQTRINVIEIFTVTPAQ